MSGQRNIWGDLAADPRALRLSIAELERAEGLCLHEVENEVSYLESVDLVLHEVKRLRWRPIGTALMDGSHVLVAGATGKPIRAWFENGRWWMHGAGPHRRNPGDSCGPYAPTHWMPLPPAPCDEPRHGGDATAAPGRSPASAVGEASSEVEAPASQDLKALQAENERLKAVLSYETRAKRVALAECVQAHAALAESERKRVEAEDRLSALLAREEAEHGR